MTRPHTIRTGLAALLLAMGLASCVPPTETPRPAVDVAAGSNHTCAVVLGGLVKCWGWGFYGQLGDGRKTDQSTPVTVPGIIRAQSVEGGHHHSCALLSEGAVKCWGENLRGELGDGTLTPRYSPVDVIGISGATQVVAGGANSCALMPNGTVRCWGDIVPDGSGDGTLPVEVVGLSDVVRITAGTGGHVCALTASGAIKCWGPNWAGQLGDGTTDASETPVDVAGIGNATDVAVGHGHTCAVLSGGSVKCWGYNQHGQLGNGTTSDSGVPVDVGVAGAAGGHRRRRSHMCAGGHRRAVLGTKRPGSAGQRDHDGEHRPGAGVPDRCGDPDRRGRLSHLRGRRRRVRPVLGVQPLGAGGRRDRDVAQPSDRRDGHSLTSSASSASSTSLLRPQRGPSGCG